MRRIFVSAINSRIFTIPVGAILYCVLATGGIFYLFRNWANDDPFITYRYSQNILNGWGFVYNPGERVLSTTTPLFTLLLAALSPLWNDLPRLAILIGALSIAFGALIIFCLANASNEPLVGWAGLLLYPPSQLLLYCLGSETPLYITFCLACFVFYRRSNYTFVAVFSALAVLTRPDGILVPVLLAADYLLNIRKPIPWKSVIIFFGLAAPWFIFSWVYFGSLIPVTLAAKHNQGLMSINRNFGTGFLTIFNSFFLPWYYRIQAGIACLGIVYMIMKSRRWILFIAWPIFYSIAYKLLGAAYYFWYYAPLLPGFTVLVGLGLIGIDWILHLSDKAYYPGAMTRRISRFAIIAFLIIPAVFQIANTIKVGDKSTAPRYTIYRDVGNWLHSNTLPGARIGTLEVGIIGYYAERPIIDFAGLIQPEIASHLGRHTSYADVADYAVQRFQPDYLVLQKGLFPNLENGYASQNCRIVHRFPGAQYNYRYNIIIYECSKSG